MQGGNTVSNNTSNGSFSTSCHCAKAKPLIGHRSGHFVPMRSLSANSNQEVETQIDSS